MREQEVCCIMYNLLTVIVSSLRKAVVWNFLSVKCINAIAESAVQLRSHGKSITVVHYL